MFAIKYRVLYHAHYARHFDIKYRVLYHAHYARHFDIKVPVINVVIFISLVLFSMACHQLTK